MKRGGRWWKRIEMLLTWMSFSRCLGAEEARARVRAYVGLDGLPSSTRSCLLS